MVDECKQSTTTSSNHVKKNFEMNTFHGGLKTWMDIKPPLCMVQEVIWSKHFQSIIESGNPRGYLICIITRGFCSHNARLFNDDVTEIGVSYWQRREFPNPARLHRGNIIHFKPSYLRWPYYFANVACSFHYRMVIKRMSTGYLSSQQFNQTIAWEKCAKYTSQCRLPLDTGQQTRHWLPLRACAATDIRAGPTSTHENMADPVQPLWLINFI